MNKTSLYVIATPIGNLDDMTPRAQEALKKADIIACEDTRRTRALLSHFGIPHPKRMISYREQTEKYSAEGLVPLLETGQTIALCSDSGYPGISDPAYRLIRTASEHNIEICVIPGASAVPTALLSSGLPTSSFTFKGYPPRKKGAIVRFFEEEKNMPHTLIIFESPFRAASTLKAALETLGDREAAVCIELTKKFEKTHRGYLSDLSAEFSGKKIKGEVTIVIAGNNPKFIKPGVSVQPSAAISTTGE